MFQTEEPATTSMRQLVEGEQRRGRCPGPRMSGAAVHEVLTVTESSVKS